MCCRDEVEVPKERFFKRWPKTLASKVVTYAKLGFLGAIGATLAGAVLIVLDAALLGSSGRRQSS